MSIEAFLDLVRQRFSPQEGQTLIRSLQQDPLVWQFVKDEAMSLPYFESAPKDLACYSPGQIATWLIEQATEEQLGDLKSADTRLSGNVRKHAASTFKTVINTGLPPADLKTAGFLALTLRERRILKGNWQGISDEIFLNGSQNGKQKNYFTWRTPFACLFEFCDDFDDLLFDFVNSKSDRKATTAIPVIMHAFLANPIQSEKLLEQLFSLTKTLPIDKQLESLKWLETFNHHDLKLQLAKNLLQTRNIVDAFAKTFSELEAFDADSTEFDPLEKQVRFTLPEDVNRLAAFYYYSGNHQKAEDTYQKSSDILEFLQCQSLFQSFTINRDRAPSSRWMKIINSFPHSKHARLFYYRSLIEDNKLDEVRRHIEELPPSPEKLLIEYQIEGSKEAKSKVLNKADETFKSNLGSASPPIQSYFVKNIKLDVHRDLLKAVNELDHPDTHLGWIDEYLQTHNNDVKVIEYARDLFIKANKSSRAIELTSYLERVEPENIDHKRSLARLYSHAERWQEGFKTLQEIIKSDPSPEIQDLERFAESALKTGKVDMAISICQNILKQADRNTKALVLLGECYWLKGDVVKAIQHMEQVVEMIPDEAETWMALSQLWKNNGQADRALEILNNAVTLLPKNAELLRSLGRAYLDNKAPKDAIEWLQQAYQIDSENIDGKLNLAQAKYQLGEYQSSWQLLEPFMNNYDEKPAAAKLIGHVLSAMGESQKAEKVLLFAADYYPDDHETVLAATRLVLNRSESNTTDLENEELAVIENILEKAFIKNQDSVEIQVHLADIDRLKGHYQKAFDTYVKLSENASSEKSGPNWRLNYGLGKSALALGNYELGLASIKEAAIKQPENLMILHALAEGYQSADLFAKAQDMAKSALKLAPQDLQNILWYARFKSNNGEPDEAVKAIKEALLINPNQPELKLWLAKSLITIGLTDESKAAIESVIEHSSTNSEELHQAAYVCIQLNELEMAVTALKKSVQNEPDFNPVLLMDLAVCYSLMDHPKNALETLNTNQDKFNDYPQLAMLKSDLLCSLGRYGVAFNTLKTIENRFGNKFADNKAKFFQKDQSPLLYTHDFSMKGYLARLGQLNRVLGEIEEAQKNFSEALSLDPDDIKLRNATVEAYFTGLNFEKALEIASQDPQSANPNDGISHDHLDLVCSQAEIHLYHGDKGKAQAIINQISQIRNFYPRFLAIQSRIANELGEIETAREHLNEAVGSYQKNLETYQSSDLPIVFRQIINILSIGEATLALDDHKGAIQFFQKAWDKLNNQPLENWRFGLALLKAAEYQQIAKTISITAHAPGNDILSEDYHKFTQKLLESLQNYLPQEQLFCLKARIKAAFNGKWPGNLNIDACLVGPDESAAVLIATDDDELAQKIIESYPNEPKVLQGYGIYALHNSKSGASVYVEKALQLDTSNPINHALLAILDKNDPEQSIKSIETALGFWPDEPEWHAIASDLYAEMGDPELAGKHISQAINTEPQNANLWQKSAQIKITRNDLANAKEDLEKSALINAKDAGVWVKMAKINQRMGNIPEAIRNFNKASEIDPNNVDIATQEIQLLVEQKNFNDAEIKAKGILQQNKENIPVRGLLAQAQAKQGKFELALETLETAIEKEPDNVYIALAKVKIRKDQNGVEAMLPELVSLAQNNPDDPDVLTTLTDWLIQTNRLKEAEETAQTVLRIIPEQAEVHLMLGRLQRLNGQLDQATAHLSDAITINPNLVDAYIELGKTYQERRDLEEAIRVFQKGSQANASDPRPYYFAGMALKECKDYSGAEIMLKQAKKYSPDDANVIRQLGVITAMNLINSLRETR